MIKLSEHNETAKQAVILIHGLGASSAMWELQVPALVAAGYRVIVPDMRGFGASNGLLDQKISIPLMAQDVAELMGHLQIERAHIVGLSMGGAIAQNFALAHPDKVQKLVLANTAARFANKFVGTKYVALRYVMLNLFSREFGARNIAKFVFSKPGQEEFREKFITQILQATNEAYFQATKSCIEHDLRSRVGEIKAPTLLIAGTRDLITPPRMLKRLQAAIAGSKLVTFDSGHVTAAECAEEFNKEVLDFLSDSH